MTKAILTLLFGFCFCLASAETLSPEIAPLAAKYEADSKVLEASRVAAVSRLQRDYVAKLAAEEQSASAEGKISEAAALLKAREAVLAASADSAPTAGMSKSQEKRHAEYFSALASVDREFAPRYQRLCADYLRALTSIDIRLPTASPAHGEIVEIKTKLIAAAVSGGSRQLSNLTFDNTEWLWNGDPKKVWKFLPRGKLLTGDGDADYYGWHILGPATFMITAQHGVDWWKFTMNFDKMEASGINVRDSNDHKVLILKGRLSK